MKRLYLILPILPLLANCSPTVSRDPVGVEIEVIESIKQYRKEYILAAGDQLEVAVYRNPELSRNVTVRGDGYISLPLLDDVRAAGLSVPELDRSLTGLLGRRLLNPEVTVIVMNAREPMVYVFGEVGRPGPVSLRQARTAAQALAHSGGITRAAATGSVAVIRLNPEGKLVANVIDKPQSGQPAFYMALQSVLLEPDDLLIVPENNRSQFVRFISDYINAPLSGVNSLFAPYFQYRLIDEVQED